MTGRKLRPDRLLGTGLIGLLAAGCQSTDGFGDRLLSNPFEDQSNLEQRIAAQPQSENGLKLGAMLPATGELGQLGRPMLQTLPLLVDTVNRCGGVNQTFVSLVLENQVAQPLEGAVALTKLVEGNRVSAVVGAFSNEVTAAALPVAVQDKVLLISPASSSPALTDRAEQGTFKDFWARTIPSDRQQGVALARLAEKRGFRDVAIVSVNRPEAIALAQSFTTAFEKQGGTVRDKTQPLRYNPGTDPLTLEELAYAAFAPFDPPDAVLAILDRNGGASLMQSAIQLGLTQGIPVMLTDAVRMDAFLQRVGKASNGTSLLTGAIGTAPAADGPGYADLAKLWQEQFGGSPSSLVAQTWDAAALVLLAAQAAKSNSREGIASKLRQVANPPGKTVTNVCEGLALLKQGQEINYDGASGKVDINAAGDVQGSYEVWAINEKGQFDAIDRIRLEP
ncbi:ABC transporter substrate-binding protein [Leptolyngbya ohadii]|uniref:ABC transporter substrate-binding protein n=1 Tax=Leptolyngbya ohadii TaxID=1962290 RepID=UPI0015C694A3|nr:ABC transporter substrate-binding protein [Leptolyngbya ohadii]